MIAVPFLFMVASTRKGRLVLLTVLCVMVSAIRSSYQNDELFIALGRHDWHEGYHPVTRRTDSQRNGSQQARILKQLGQLLWFRASSGEPVMAMDEWRSHVSSTVSAEEIVMHLRQEVEPTSWLDRFRSPFLRRRHEKMNVDGSYSLENQIDLSVLSSMDLSAGASQQVKLQSLTEPLILRDVWTSLTGEEFKDHPELLEPLAIMGEQVARSSENDRWIDWKPHGKNNDDDSESSLTVKVWTGRARDAKNYHGSDIPFVKTRSRLPMSPAELKDLLLDSSRVKTYNSFSTGRKDCWVPDTVQKQTKQTAVSNNYNIETKIVKNKAKVPLGPVLVGVTLLHARPLANGAWIVVSRAVGGNAYFEEEDLASAGRSDILLGVNLIEPVVDDEESCLLTAVTQAYSSAIPSLMAESLGVKSAIKFVQDMRKLKVPA